MENMELMPEKLKNLTERSWTDRENNEELFEKVEKLLAHKEEFYTEWEDAISSLRKRITKAKFKHFWNNDNLKRLLQENINKLKNSLKQIDADIASFREEPLATVTNHLSPGLIEKIENVAEELDSIIEDFELGLKFHKQFTKLEKGFEKYSKNAKKINLSKKVV